MLYVYPLPGDGFSEDRTSEVYEEWFKLVHMATSGLIILKYIHMYHTQG